MSLTQLRRALFDLRKPRILTRLILLLVLSLPLLATAGCAGLQTRFMPLATAPIELNIRQVEPSGRPGIYSVAGSASLPDRTQIAVSAIRYLQDPAQLPADASPAYSILDRQLAEVNQGNWEANLNLWQVAPDGTFQEAWQLSQPDTEGELNPESNVTFLATLDPSHQPANLKDQVENQDEAVQATLVRFTTEGELYLQASKALTVALPTGSTTPPPASPIIRSSVSEDPAQAAIAPRSGDADAASTNWSQTNAPLTPDQILR